MSANNKKEIEMHQPEIAADAADPSRAVAMTNMALGSNAATGAEEYAKSFTRETLENQSTIVLSETTDPNNGQSFTHETSEKQPVEPPNLVTQVTNALRAECDTFREYESHYPKRYHRLGTRIIESRRHLSADTLAQVLRAKGINDTKAWRAEQIAKLYTYEQAVQFPTLHAIMTTIPTKQPRNNI